MVQLRVETARPEQIDEIVALNERVFGEAAMTGWSDHQLTAHLDVFPEGQFVALLDDQLVASSSSFLVDRERALEPHTWMSITGGNQLPNQDPDGDCLYGLEIMVDPEHRGMGLASLLYRARKTLARAMDLWGIVLGGRMPGYAEAHEAEPELTPERYVDEVVAGERSDPVLSVQASQGFEPDGILENYVKDAASEHLAARMVWRV